MAEEDLHAPPFLNQDVYDLVIDCLRHDPPSLSACALVCHDWTRRAQRHLFHTIALQYTHVQMWKDKNSMPSRFVSFLKSRPDIARLVRSLIIRGERSLFVNDHRKSICLSQFSELRSLTISRVLLSTSLVNIASMISCIPRLQELVLKRVLFVNFADSNTWSRPSAPVPLSPLDSKRRRGSRTLRRLTFSCLETSHSSSQNATYQFLLSLARSGELNSLSSLKLFSGPEITDIWLPLFPAVGPTLEHCAISINDALKMDRAPRRWFYQNRSEEELSESRRVPRSAPSRADGYSGGYILDFYNALLPCSRLRKLTILYDGFQTLQHLVLPPPHTPNAPAASDTTAPAPPRRSPPAGPCPVRA